MSGDRTARAKEVRDAWSATNKDGDWLLLGYLDDNVDSYRLLQSDNGLPSLRNAVGSVSEHGEAIPVIVLFRVEFEGIHTAILINIIPDTIRGVTRARALVRSREVMAIVQAPTTTLSLDTFNLDHITQDYLLEAISKPDQVDDPAMDRFITLPKDHTTPSKLGKLKSFLRRGTKSTGGPSFDMTDSPPPPPPKDKPQYTTNASQHALTLPSYARYPLSSQNVGHRPRSSSLSDFAVISHELLGIQPTRSLSPDAPAPRFDPPQARSSKHHGKWSHDPPNKLIDPAERTRRRHEAQRQRHVEEQEALRQEAERQAAIKLEKARAAQAEQEAEEHRKALLEEEVRHATAERRRKEIVDAEEERQRLTDIEHQKRVDKERRLEEGRRMTKLRAQLAEQLAAEQRSAAEALKHEEEQRKSRIKLAAKKVKSVDHNGDSSTGCVTMQTSDSLVWRRRYFRFVDSTVFFYRSPNPQDLNQILDKLELRGRMVGVREWNQGYDELKALKHSFALEFTDGTPPWSFYSDTQDAKDQLIVLLYNAAGLKVA